MELIQSPYILSIIGGCLIGAAAGTYYLFLGRIFGISGFIFSLLEKPISIRVFSLLGLLASGIILNYLGLFNEINEVASYKTLLIAGFFVGYGSYIGNGCTSGHGICGISRFSKRSIVSVLTFMTSAILTLFIIKKLGL